MKYLPLLWAGLWRRRARTILTVLSIVVAFVLFGILSGINAGFAHSLEASRLDRLFTDPRFGAPLPHSYAEQIARVPGVALVAPRRVLGGYYRSPNNGQGVLCIDARFFSLRPEITITKEQIAKLRQTRTGAVVSVALQKLYGWKVGDKVPLQTQTLQVDGSTVWTFDIVGIVDDTDYPGQAGWFLANYEYLNEGRAADKNTIDRFLVRIKDPNRATQISRQIDKLFINSGAPTRTTSEKSRSQSDIQFLGDVNLFTHAIVAAVFFMLLFVTGNTMMQSVRERIPEIAVLKTIGFTDNSVLWLVIAEAVLLCLIAATAGLLLSKLAIPLMGQVLQDYISVLQTGWTDLLRGFGLALIVAVISSLYPAWRSRRLSIVSGLSRH